MSVAIMAQVWARSAHKSGDLLVLLAMADHADDSGICWPSIKKLTEKARMTERNVQLCLRKLEKAGEIIAVEKGGIRGGKRCATVYRITMGENSSPNTKGEISSTPTVKPTTPQPSAEPSGYVFNKVMEDMGIFVANTEEAELEKAITLFANSRQERKKKLTKTACDLLVKRIIALGQPAAILALRESAEKGWSSIYPPKEERKVSMSIPSPQTSNGMLSGARRIELQRQRANK